MQTYSHPNLIKKLPPEVKILFKIFGQEIRLVGGCVRDLLLEKKVNDFDFACKFLPQETIKILQKNKIKALPTGVKFGTITAVINGKNFEITTLRKDLEENGRHCEPQFIDDYFLDAARRDFTINALYLDFAGLVYDYFDGISDLKKQKVKFIGDAKKRISEDYLRILRFFRFSCEYGVKLEKQGLAACAAQKENLKKLSRQRIRAEILKMLSSPKKENLIKTLRILFEAKIFAQIFSAKPDFESLEKLFAIEKKLKIVASLNLKIAILFLQKTTNLTIFFDEICATNLEKKYLKFLATNSVSNLELSSFKPFLCLAQNNEVLDFYLFKMIKEFGLQELSIIKKNSNFLQKFLLPKFPLNSSDFVSLGFKEKELGIAIKQAKTFWAQNNFQPEKEILINFLLAKNNI